MQICIVDSEQNFYGSAGILWSQRIEGFIQILGPDFGRLEVRIVDLNVAPESSLSIFNMSMSRNEEND